MGPAESRTKSCRSLAPGKVWFCGLPRLVMSCGLLGLKPGANPWPCATARPPDKSKIAVVAYRRFIDYSILVGCWAALEVGWRGLPPPLNCLLEK